MKYFRPTSRYFFTTWSPRVAASDWLFDFVPNLCASREPSASNDWNQVSRPEVVSNLTPDEAEEAKKIKAREGGS